ncbi:MAG: hypothetical protein AAGH49_09310 [Pseudomonadota bacterium]
MTQPPKALASDRARIADELAQAKALQLLTDPVIEAGVESNLALLQTHYAIVLAAHNALDAVSK